MGESTEISWTDSTFNTHWGCQRVSPGCENCYAETFSKRLGLKVWGPQAERRTFGDKHWNEPIKWNAKAEKAGIRHRVFCSSMADVFEDRRDLDEVRARLWGLIAETPWLDWQLLTKRPENAERLWNQAQIASTCTDDPWGPVWRENVWLGTTVEDCQRRDERLPHLLRTPAKTKFLSMEPLLEEVSIADYLVVDGPEWVIVGGESGGGSRPFDLAWAESLRDQCRAAGVAWFFKQAGSRPFRGQICKFDSFDQWVAKARDWTSGRGGWFVDAKGRTLNMGADFSRARDDGSFPVRVLAPMKLRDRKPGTIHHRGLARSRRPC